MLPVNITDKKRVGLRKVMYGYEYLRISYYNLYKSKIRYVCSNKRRTKLRINHFAKGYEIITLEDAACNFDTVKRYFRLVRHMSKRTLKSFIKKDDIIWE